MDHAITKIDDVSPENEESARRLVYLKLIAFRCP